MKKYLEKLPLELKEIISLARKVSEEIKMPAYLVGGFVRDLFLGVNNLDLDIGIEGNGILFAEKLNAKFFNVPLTAHQRFGTATIFLPAGLRIDITTLRKESYAYAGCLPEVCFSCLNDDLLRRDFTVNAMAISIHGADYGKLIDLFNGLGDIRKKKIRVLHDLSFHDDPTRIFRAVRFEQRFGFKIESHTLGLLKEAFKSAALSKVSHQRLRQELVLILKEKSPYKCIRRANQLTGFDFISPVLKLSRESRLIFNSCKTQINWFIRNYPHRRSPDAWIIYLMALMHSLSQRQIKKVCAKFSLHIGDQKRLLSIKLSKKSIAELSDMRTRPARIYEILEPLSYESIIFLRVKFKSVVLRKQIALFLKKYNGMHLHISGKDLQELGVKPGPRYKEIFSKVLKARLNQQVKDRKEELELIKRFI